MNHSQICPAFLFEKSSQNNPGSCAVLQHNEVHLASSSILRFLSTLALSNKNYVFLTDNPKKGNLIKLLLKNNKKDHDFSVLLYTASSYNNMTTGFLSYASHKAIYMLILENKSRFVHTWNISGHQFHVLIRF